MRRTSNPNHILITRSIDRASMVDSESAPYSSAPAPLSQASLRPVQRTRILGFGKARLLIDRFRSFRFSICYDSFSLLRKGDVRIALILRRRERERSNLLETAKRTQRGPPAREKAASGDRREKAERKRRRAVTGERKAGEREGEAVTGEKKGRAAGEREGRAREKKSGRPARERLKRERRQSGRTGEREGRRERRRSGTVRERRPARERQSGGPGEREAKKQSEAAWTWRERSEAREKAMRVWYFILRVQDFVVIEDCALVSELRFACCNAREVASECIHETTLPRLRVGCMEEYLPAVEDILKVQIVEAISVRRRFIEALTSQFGRLLDVDSMNNRFPEPASEEERKRSGTKFQAALRSLRIASHVIKLCHVMARLSLMPRDVTSSLHSSR
ncbi:hypothetical protein Syun_010255 [Stephania yunnanensis]|uniref:Uncharacterized protein n=1 Tax=Stephania yunnanensis TaxID=152371 RepID=A0AAP0PT34_9MAGN